MTQSQCALERETQKTQRTRERDRNPALLVYQGDGEERSSNTQRDGQILTDKRRANGQKTQRGKEEENQIKAGDGR